MRSIAEWLGVCKNYLRENRRDLLLSLAVAMIAAAGFGLGRLSALMPVKGQIEIEELPANAKIELAGQLPVENTEPATGAVVASKNGSRFHLPNCPGALQIKEENKIRFASVEAAIKAGYQPAANCPGLTR